LRCVPHEPRLFPYTTLFRSYRLSDGNQLVAVTGGPMEVAGLPMQIALRGNPANNGDISLLDGKGVLYRLCGLGPKCAIAEGKPRSEEHTSELQSRSDLVCRL